MAQTPPPLPRKNAYLDEDSDVSVGGPRPRYGPDRRETTMKDIEARIARGELPEWPQGSYDDRFG